ncbi:MAG: TRAP transporter large permease subunit [Planctomycetes bacterium]|nr:TRAP transporter large permease subunit [Planctomycetota bacterium]
MPEFLTTIVTGKARDLWSWVSHRFELVDDPTLRTEFDTLLDRADSRLTLIDGLSLQEKTQRISVLQDQLQKAKNAKTNKVQHDIYNQLVELADIHYSLAQYTDTERYIREALAVAEKIFGRSPGGPAKISVLGSGLMGSLSGSAVANAVTTGAFTIPMMRNSGFEPRIALEQGIQRTIAWYREHPFVESRK